MGTFILLVMALHFMVPLITSSCSFNIITGGRDRINIEKQTRDLGFHSEKIVLSGNATSVIASYISRGFNLRSPGNNRGGRKRNQFCRISKASKKSSGDRIFRSGHFIHITSILRLYHADSTGDDGAPA